MANQSNNTIVLVNGISRTIGSTDTITVAGGLDSTPVGLVAPSTGAFTTLAASSTLAITGVATFSSDVNVGGDLTVAGDIISKGVQNLVVQDPVIDLGIGNSTTSATAGGFSLTMNRNADFDAATVTATSAGTTGPDVAPTIVVANAGGDLFIADDIVCITGSATAAAGNDGLYLVLSVANDTPAPGSQTLTLYGTGSTAVNGSVPFCQGQLETTSGGGATGLAFRIDLAALIFADGTASFKDIAGGSYAKGSLVSTYTADAVLADFTGNGSYLPSGGTLQNAYNAGNSITTAGGVDILFTLTSGGFTVNGTGNVDLGADATAQTLNFGTGAAVKSVTAGSTTGASATTLRSGTGAMTFTAGGAFDVNATGTLSLDTSGAIDIGAGAAAGNISIGTNATARSVTLGNTTGASSLNVNTGSGAATLTLGGTFDVNATGLVSIDTAGDVTINSSGGTLNIGNADDDFAINVGNNGVRAILIGNENDDGAVNGTNVSLVAGGLNGFVHVGTNATDHAIGIGAAVGSNALTATTGTGDMTFAAGGNYIVNATNTVYVNSSGSDINIGNNGDNHAINIGTGGNRAIAIGATGGSSSLALNAGSGNMALNVNAGAFSIDATNAVEINSSGASINIGNDAVAQAINIGTGAAARTVTIGNATGASSTVIQAGTGKVVVEMVDNATPAFVVKEAGNVYLGIITANGAENINIGCQSLNAAVNIQSGTGTISIGTDGSARTVALGSVTGASSTTIKSGTGVLSITALGALELDSAAGTGFWNMLDNSATALKIKQGANNYIVFDTTDGKEATHLSKFVDIASTAGLYASTADGLVAGDVLYYHDASLLSKADASVQTKLPVGVAFYNAAAGNVYAATVPGTLVPVTMDAATVEADVGKVVYLDAAAAGRGTLTPPSTSGQVVYRLGIVAGAGATPNVLWAPQFIANLA